MSSRAKYSRGRGFYSHIGFFRVLYNKSVEYPKLGPSRRYRTSYYNVKERVLPTGLLWVNLAESDQKKGLSKTYHVKWLRIWL